MQEEGDRRLAIRSRDAREAKLPRGMAVQCGGGMREGLTGVSHLGPGKGTGFRGDLLGHDAESAGLDRVRDELMSVDRRPF